MLKSFHKNKYLLIAFILYFSSIIIVNIDKEFKYKWFALFLWILSMLIPFLYFLRIKKPGSIKKRNRKELAFLIILGILAFVTRFIFLSVYPFTSIGDELRDGGLDAMHISNGVRENIFAYGRYDAHGLNAPLFALPFYKILGNTTLAFKVPAALVSILDIFLVYFICKKYINKKVAIGASLVLLALPLHMYYARSEIVVIFTSLLTTVLFGGIWNWLSKKDIKSFGLLGLIVGFGFGFHASLRTLLFFTIGLVFIVSIYEKIHLRQRAIELTRKLAIFVSMVLIGIGPRILFTTPEILFHTKRLPGIELTQDSLSKKDKVELLLKSGIENYPKSFMVYLYEPTTSHFHDRKPILTFILGVFFLAGLVIGLIGKNKYIKILCIYAIFIPFTNSAITDIVNGDHRLASLFPIASVLCAYGIYKVYKSLKESRTLLSKAGSILLVLFIGAILANNVLYFFNSQQGSYSMARFNDDKIYQDFMVMHSINVIKSSPLLNDSPNICITTSLLDYEFFNFAHIREHYEFLLPMKSVQVVSDPNNYSGREIRISNYCATELSQINWNEYTYCQKWQKFVCPPDKSSFKVYKQTF